MGLPSKKFLPDIYNDIMNYTNWLSSDASMSERLFCYTTNITSYPKCLKCNNSVTYSSKDKKYYNYCSNNCSILDIAKSFSVTNVSQLQSVKDKKKKSAQEKYGVDNVSQAEEIKEKISKKVIKYWDKIYEGKDFNSEGLTMKQYSHRCHQYAETQYFRNIANIDPNKLRGKDWHVDHIFSVFDGWINNIPINIISDISNLRLITSAQNLKKYRKSEKSIKQLYEDYYLLNPHININMLMIKDH